jgi:hypothetical protein
MNEPIIAIRVVSDPHNSKASCRVNRSIAFRAVIVAMNAIRQICKDCGMFMDLRVSRA